MTKLNRTYSKGSLERLELAKNDKILFEIDSKYIALNYMNVYLITELLDY